MSYFDYEKYNLSLSGKRERPDENPEDVRSYLMGKLCVQRDEEDLIEYDPFKDQAPSKSFFQIPTKVQKTLTSEELKTQQQ